MYIDQYNESIFNWIEEEIPDKYDSIVKDEDQVDDFTFSDTILPGHEEDDVVSSRKPLDHSFLNALCPNKKLEDGSNTDATDEEVDVKPTYHVHDQNQNWKKMVPILGMKFYDPSELKCLLSNYVVRHGYNLWKLFWAAVNSTTVPQFEEAIDGIKKLNPNAYDHLIDREPKYWLKDFFV
ncbi:unnamed protein product [Lactuca saligna]|uniref:Uncharacterized protein n=1 Tax=Lactuca saligna TaxID=75948 RepID=A0AA35YBP2_LACSI|nr:unnamed protein product [Lactuca saligna]